MRLSGDQWTIAHLHQHLQIQSELLEARRDAEFPRDVMKRTACFLPAHSPARGIHPQPRNFKAKQKEPNIFLYMR
ncbi:hypothetical protein [Hyalangium gracile]|uniref:hypothetical protein n=1 Tax=Hyalangium gracile TaxID=394092 RepID=UPI001CCE3947|nr:hypothetical protein [Hyalangium gracile]